MNVQWFELAQYLAIIGLVSIVLMYACNTFEGAAGYLGRNLNGGARGALVDAIGSSLPELLVTLMFVASGKPELILAGVAVTAGSSIFNSVLIPALSILAAKDSEGNKVDSFPLERAVIARDGFWLLTIEAVLIYMLGMSQFTMTMAGVLLLIYVCYAFHVIFDSSRMGDDEDDYEFEQLDHTETPSFISWVGKCLDFNNILFGNKPFTTKSAWVVLGLAVIVVAITCHFLAVGVEGTAVATGIPVFFSAVVLGAAATSVPDTILSVKSAKRGDYEDAVANAIGSNIFDVGPALVLPIMLALSPLGAIMFGIETEFLPIDQDAKGLTELRYFVLGTSAVVIAALLAQAKNVTHKTAYFLLGLYAVWMGFIILGMSL